MNPQRTLAFLFPAALLAAAAGTIFTNFGLGIGLLTGALGSAVVLSHMPPPPGAA